MIEKSSREILPKIEYVKGVFTDTISPKHQTSEIYTPYITTLLLKKSSLQNPNSTICHHTSDGFFPIVFVVGTLHYNISTPPYIKVSKIRNITNQFHSLPSPTPNTDYTVQNRFSPTLPYNPMHLLQTTYHSTKAICSNYQSSHSHHQ